MGRIQLYQTFILLFISILLLTGCSSVEQTQLIATNDDVEITATGTATDIPPTSSPTKPDPTDTPTAVLPTDTATTVPSITPTITHTETVTQTPTDTPAPVGEKIRSVPNGALIYFIHRNTGGPVCGMDSAIGVRSGAAQTNNIAKDIKAALKELFSYHSEWVGGFYNPLYRSKIRVQSVDFEDGLVTVNLSGTYIMPEDDCDNLRVRAQVWATVRQYPEVKATNIYLGRVPFGDRVSNDR